MSFDFFFPSLLFYGILWEKQLVNQSGGVINPSWALYCFQLEIKRKKKIYKRIANAYLSEILMFWSEQFDQKDHIMLLMTEHYKGTPPSRMGGHGSCRGSSLSLRYLAPRPTTVGLPRSPYHHRHLRQGFPVASLSHHSCIISRYFPYLV